MASITLWAFLNLLSFCYAQSGDELLLLEIQKLTEVISNQKTELLTNFEEIKEEMKEEMGALITEAKADWQTMTNNTQNDVATLQNLLDIDECSNLSHNCSADASCIDTMVSFRCKCKPGFTGDGYTCEDIDECSQRRKCGTFATCTNTPGSYYCTCRAGFRGNGHFCEDVDECSEGTNRCHKYAICTNTRGSYSCKCTLFHRGNGRICRAIGGVTCGEPYEYVKGVGCIKYISKEMDFTGSRKNCEKMGGDLFVATDADHYLRLTQHFLDADIAAGQYIYVGVKEGVWLNGREVNDKEEAKGNPTMGSGKCSYMDGDYAEKFLLWTHPCSWRRNSLCQKKQ